MVNIALWVLKYWLNFVLFFWYLCCVDRVQEGMRELDPLKDKADINLGATVALLYGHKKSRTVGEHCSAITYFHSGNNASWFAAF